MWRHSRETLDDDRLEKFFILQGDSLLTYRAVVAYWRSDPGFRVFFNSVLAGSKFESFRWETPAVTVRLIDRPFEFVLVDDPGLQQPADAAAFSEHFARTEDSVTTFQNLRGDSTLIVPCPSEPLDAYAHLAAFVRLASVAQADALWQAVGIAMAARLHEAPVWLSTAGLGVAWLHVRIDPRPKYYSFAQYRDGV